MIPKIYYKSSPRRERCLEAWENFFRVNKIPYRTDGLTLNLFDTSPGIAVFFGSWKNRTCRHHRVKNSIVYSGIPFIVNETSLLGREKVSFTFEEDWFRIGVNGFLSDTGYFNNINSPADRWLDIQKRRGIELFPWSNSGLYILVALQLPGDASLRGSSIEDWALSICRHIRSKTDFPILLRKPQLPIPFDEHKISECLNMTNVSLQLGTRENLFDTIDNCIFACTFSSGIGIDLVLRGKPVVVSSKASFVYPIRTSIEEAVEFNFNKPCRNELLYNLAYAQWHIDEIKQGLPWNHLLPVVKKIMQRNCLHA